MDAQEEEEAEREAARRARVSQDPEDVPWTGDGECRFGQEGRELMSRKVERHLALPVRGGSARCSPRERDVLRPA